MSPKEIRERTYRATGLAIACALSLSCAGDDGVAPLPVPVRTIEVTPATAVLAPDSALLLRAVLRGPAGEGLTGRDVIWTSSDDAVATVSDVGLVTALGDGVARIQATSEGRIGAASITVQRRAVAVAVLSPSAAVERGRILQLTVLALDGKGDTIPNVKAVWISSDTVIATVDSTGAFRARRGGTVDVTATVEGVAGSDSVTVLEAFVPPAAPERVAVGTNHACVVDDAGAVHCWGSGAMNAIGRTSDYSSHAATPLRVHVPEPARGVAAGLNFTCALGVSGTVYCWGWGADGRLGYGGTGNQVVPFPVAGSVKFRFISASWNHACGVGTDGRGYCWGWDRALVPTPVPGNLGLSSVSAGVGHNCGVTTGGYGYCWGANGQGKLGDGTTANATAPVLVGGDLVFKSVKAGGHHSCGLTREGSIYCWGWGDKGRLGNGIFGGEERLPVAVGEKDHYASVSTGHEHVCAVDLDGAATCWGGNTSGQLGVGDTENRATPTEVLGAHAFAAVSAGYRSTCGATLDGASFCWGNGEAGLLGNGAWGDQPTPALVDLAGPFRSISAGAAHTCAVDLSGAGACWGSGGGGALGTGGTEDSATPLAVSGTERFSTISAGAGFTCGLDEAGGAHCWGESVGEARSTPTPVEGGLTFTTISAGEGFACAITEAGAAYCWGRGAQGQLGDSLSVNRYSPNPVAGGLTFKSVDAGTFHTCGVTTDGVGYCWGTGAWGALGNGSTQDQPRPVPVLTDLRFEHISADHTFSCGNTPNGTTYCWGAGAWGKLGHGVPQDTPTPSLPVDGVSLRRIGVGVLTACGLDYFQEVHCWGSADFGVLGPTLYGWYYVAWASLVPLGFKAVNLAVGGSHVCATDANGRLYCWGSNSNGQIGNGLMSHATTPQRVWGVVVTPQR